MKNPVLLSLVDKVISKDNIDSTEINHTLKEIQTQIELLDFNQEFKLELDKFLTDIKMVNRVFAVRSSATFEDGMDNSFAGIHSSFLEVSGITDIINSLKKCFASLWTTQAYFYRQNKDIPHREVECAVLVCEMVKNPLVAGVMFTADPLTGRRDQMILNYTEGLADKLVSGHINPEEIILEIKSSLDIEIIRINCKTNYLTDDKLKELFCLADRILWALGDGQQQQDIEWVFDGEVFWFVQARPITNLPYPTFDEISTLPIIWSNGNFKDAIPGVQSTLSWSNLQNTIRHILYIQLDKLKLPKPKGMEIVRRFEGRMYFDLTCLQWSLYKYFNVSPKETNNSLGGHQPEIPINKNGLLDIFKKMLNTQKLLKVLKKEMKTIIPEINKLKVESQKYKNMDWTNMSKKDLQAHTQELTKISMDFACKFQLVNNVSGADFTILEMLLKKIVPLDYIQIGNGLMSNSELVTSAEQGYRLYDLANIISKDSFAKDFFEQTKLSLEDFYKIPSESLFIKEFKHYLKDFGHRGVYEGEIANPRWNDDPSFILQQVQQIYQQGKIPDVRKKAQDNRKNNEDLLNQKVTFFRPLVNYLAAKARKSAARREEAKSTLARLLEPSRNIMLNIGERLQKTGKIVKKEDIFQLSIADIRAYILDYWDAKGAANLVTDRKIQDQKWNNQNSEDVIITDKLGMPTKFDFQSSIVTINKKELYTGKIIKGIPVSSGIAKGKAKIIRHPSEGHKLDFGDILVAPSTDPGWTPLFLKASAIIMEVGGHLSHGAIVSREYGLPAVVNVPGILDTLEDGQILTVNGNRGEIIISNT